MNKWLTLLLAVVMIASIGLAGCGNSDDSTSGSTDSNDSGTTNENNDDTAKLDSEQVIRYNLPNEPTSLDSTLATYAQDLVVLNNIQEGLVRIGKDGKTAEGGIAEKWDVSEDKLTYTFHLRDAKWSNGDAVTAQDFEYGWKLAMNPKTGSQYSSLFGATNIIGANEFVGMSPESSDADLKAAADKVGIKALDDKTFEVKLSAPSPFLLDLCAFATFYPVNQKFFESLEAGAYGTTPETLIYNGPFKMTEWNHEESIKAVKNDTYWDAETVKLQEIEWTMVTDSNTRFNLYLAGDLDATSIPEQFLAQYKEDELTVKEPEAVTFWFYTNLKGEGVKGEYLRNKNFRHALAIGFDRQTFVDVVSAGTYLPAFGIIPPGMKGTAPDKDFREEFKANTEIQVKDIEKAKELLAQAQQEVGKPLPTFELLVSDSDLGSKMGQVLQEQYKQLGVSFTINQQPSKVQKELRKTFNYDVSFTGWSPDYDDPSSYMDLFQSQNSFNEHGFNNPQYDDLLKQASTEADFVKRQQLYAEAEKLVLEDYSIIPVYHRMNFVQRQQYVKDLVQYNVGPDYSLKWAYISGKE